MTTSSGVAKELVKVLLLATNNVKKRGELAALVKAMLQEEFSVCTLKELQLDDVDFVEDRDTFAGNARVKIDAIVEALCKRGQSDEVFAVLADDSGLVVDALDGGPGVRSARFASDFSAGEGDDDNNALLLKKLEMVEDKKRSARYACAICLQTIGHDDVLEAFGTVEGHIARSAKGEGGFGYDPYFLPDERPGLRMAELSADDKSAISHRGKATRAVLRMLSDELSKNS